MQTAVPKTFTYLGLKIQGDLGPFTCYTSSQGQVVWYLKAPPKTPPSWQQFNQRDTFVYTGWCWSCLTPAQKAVWKAVAARACLRITGYDLFTYYCVTGDEPPIETVERQATIALPRTTQCP